MTRKTLRICALTAAATLAAIPAATAESAGNVRITVESGRLDGKSKVSPSRYSIVTSYGDAASLNVGTRLPMPTSVANPDAAPSGSAPVVSFSYQTIGVAAKLKALPVEGGRIQVRGEISSTYLRSDATSHPVPGGPAIGTLNQDVNVSVRPGRAVRVLSVDEPGVGAFYVEITVEPED